MEQERQQINSQFEQIADEKIIEKKRVTSFGELLKKSFRIFKQGASKFLSMALLVPLLGMIPLVIVGMLYAMVFIINSSTLLADNSIILILQMIFGLLVFISILVFLYVLCVSTIGMYILLRDFSPDLKVKEAFKRARPYFWKFIVVNLFVGILVMLWGLLFIIPGIIFLIYYFFAEWVLIFESYEGMSALKRSKELVKGYWWSVFGRFLTFGLIHLVIILVLSIPLIFIKEGSGLEFIWNFTTSMLDIIISIIFVIYSYLIYKDLAEIKSNSPSQVEKKKGGKKIIIVAMVLIFLVPITTIILVSLNSARMKSRDAYRVANIKTIQLGLKIYYNEHNGRYPTNLDDLVNSTSFISEDKIKDPYGYKYYYKRSEFDNYKLCFELEEKGGFSMKESCVTKDDFEEFK